MKNYKLVHHTKIAGLPDFEILVKKSIKENKLVLTLKNEMKIFSD